MSPLFPRWANIAARLSLVLVVLLVVAAAVYGYNMVRSPRTTDVGVARAQPVPYSHELHVGELGMDCRYCHTAVETSSTAGIPSTETCMACHDQVATDSPELEAVRTSAEEGEPLAWTRVHNLADYVHFNHAIHVNQGFGCETCHGRVDQMDVVAKAEPMTMAWCLDCHRDPAQYIRPRSEVTTMGWAPETERNTLGPQLVEEYGIQVGSLTDCSICHR